MSDFYEDFIRPQLTELMKKIDVTDHQMLSYMYQEKMITEDDQHNLAATSQMSPSEKQRLFFQTILARGLGSEAKFRTFCTALTKRRGAHMDDLAQLLLAHAKLEDRTQHSMTSRGLKRSRAHGELQTAKKSKASSPAPEDEPDGPSRRRRMKRKNPSRKAMREGRRSQEAKRKIHLLVVCALPKELEAAKDAIGAQEWEEIRSGTMGYRVFVADVTWKNHSKKNEIRVTVGVVAQSKSGGQETSNLLGSLNSQFDVNFLAMTGCCAGVEDVDCYSVIVADKTTALEREKHLESAVQHQVGPGGDLEHELIQAVNSLLMDLKTSDWLDPEVSSTAPPSPRLVRESLLKAIEDSGKSSKDAIEKAVQEIKNVNKDIYPNILNKLVKEGLIEKREEKEPQMRILYCLSAEGAKHVSELPFGLLSPDKDPSVRVTTLFTCQDVLVNLKSVLPKLKEATGQRKITGVDMEAHHFMVQAKHFFPKSSCIVMKGVSDHGSPESKEKYNQEYASKCATLFLKYFLEKNFEYLEKKKN
ncbi:uncharacterized protein [Oscarella lobularis]|uniref:uncharacterized protein isoform X2 n=1 Tax=Oscarella lobularis TaxID=121494 RepID=UPI003313CF4E